MTHPVLDQLRTFAAGEPGMVRDRVAAHLEQCHACRNTVIRMREVVAVAREDLAPPATAFDRIVERRRAGERVILPVAEPSQPRPSRMSRSLPWAAGLLLVAGVAAAAVPGSPLREWIAKQFGDAPVEAPRAQTPVDSLPAGAAAEDTTASGVLIPIDAGDLWVSAEAESQPFRVRVRLTDASELEVRGSGAATGAVFRPRDDGIAISNGRGGEVEVLVPRATRRFVLRVGAKQYLVKTGGRMRVLAPADTVAGELIFEVKP